MSLRPKGQGVTLSRVKHDGSSNAQNTKRAATESPEAAGAAALAQQRDHARPHPIQRGAHRRRRRHLSPRLRFWPRRDRLEADRLALRQRPDARLAEEEEPGVREAMIGDRA